jgi:hypothetical protein
MALQNFLSKTHKYKLPSEMKLIQDLKLDNVLIKTNEELTALKVTDKWYKVFHRTGWWKVPSEYFEKGD